MTTHAYVRPGNVWNSGQIVSHQEFAALDFGQFDSISASGGVYAPGDSPIQIGGLGLTVTGQFMALHAVIIGTDGTDVLTVNSTATFEHDVNVGGFATVTGGFTVGGAAALTGNVTIGSSGSDTLSVQAAATFIHGFVAQANSTIDNCVLSFAGTAELAFGSGTELSIGSGASAICQGDFNLSGAGTIVERVVTGTDADGTYSVSSADLVYIPAGTISAARNYFIDEVGAVNGKKIRFHRADRSSSNPITLKRSSDSSVILTLTWDATGYTWTDLVRIAGVWQAVGGFIHP